MSGTIRPTRRQERRAQTIREIKELAMDQVSAGGPESVSLSGIVREMSMSPAAVYRYFANRDALLADLVVDAYNELADHLVVLEQGPGSASDHLDAVLHGIRTWALAHPNAYRLIFQTSIGSGQDFAVDRTVPAASRSMTVIINALAAVATHNDPGSTAGLPSAGADLVEVLQRWAERTDHRSSSPELLILALLTWTRLHGVISLELGGHLAATGVGAAVLFKAEVDAIRYQAGMLPPTVSDGSAG